MSAAPALRADAYALEYADPRGFRQAYTREGAGGVPLLLLHGWPETRRIWWRNVGPLAEAGFEVIAPDLRGFGDSQLGPDGIHDTVASSLDLHALVHEHLGHDSVVVAAGDFGGTIAQDLSLRFPGFVERMLLFNCPLRYLKGKMDGLRTRPPLETADYFLRQGQDADGLAADLDTADRRRRYIATFYTSRLWAHPGGFTPEEVAFHSEPFADGAKLRAGFGAYESAFSEKARAGPALLGENPTHTLILFGTSDHVIYPDFDRMAAVSFHDHVGPFLVRDAGHFLQWEAAELLNGALRAFCRDRLVA